MCELIALSAEPAARFVGVTAMFISDWLPLLRDALAHEGRFRWRLRGTSMTPTLPPDCEVEIAPLPPAVPLGSLVVFADGDALVVHRLVRRAAGRWITQGDGRLAPDRSLAPNQVLGVVVAADSDGRRCWPGPDARAAIPFWLARHHVLRVLRYGWRKLLAAKAGVW
ncbi:MAG: S24/S26 family peptidase [Chloroflexi bacterium]|nr:S24/S26 family peptidase [Chloroflexota bacterium]